ncbi:MAG TPA: hypothetical protein VGS19_34795 [Streptosporangiaceae bacterium]|nr:hypothetical protein [Streptosporangiaceae bacterium]
MPVRISLLGSGALAHALCHALARTLCEPAEVTVLARNGASAADLCYTATVTARLAGRPVTFDPVVAELGREGGATSLFTALRPDGLVVCASPQSPWEGLRRPSAWTDLVDRAGFGLTLPLQAELAVWAGRGLGLARPRAWLVNACFPDATNAVLVALGIPVCCGIGNVATLAAGLQCALGLTDQRRLQVVAHHAQARAPRHSGDEALVWLDGKPCTDTTTLLAAHQSIGRPVLNLITGQVGALLLDAMVTGAECATHAPGPLGLPGGYPILIRDGVPRLRLPPGLNQAEAVAANQRAAVWDGVVVADGQIRFSPAAAAELRQEAPQLADGLPAAHIARASGCLREVRDRLRAQPSQRAR